MLKEKREEY